MSNTNQTYTVSLYGIDDEYGGPEEGGWYYESCTPIESSFTKSGMTREAAQDYRDALKPLATIGEDNHDALMIMSGVRHADSDYTRYKFRLDLDGYVKPYPVHKPIYT